MKRSVTAMGSILAVFALHGVEVLDEALYGLRPRRGSTMAGGLLGLQGVVQRVHGLGLGGGARVTGGRVGWRGRGTGVLVEQTLGALALDHAVCDGIGVTLYEADGNLRPLDAIEADVIRLAIGHYRGRMTEVARRLGIGRSTLYRKLADLGIDNAAA